MKGSQMEAFRAQGAQFTSFLSKHQFMHSFIEGNQSESLAKESEITELQQENLEKHEQFLEVAAALKEEMKKLEDMKSRHAAVKERVDDVLKDEENTVPGLECNSKRLVMEEIVETERVLFKLTGEHKTATTMIVARQERNAGLRKEITKVEPTASATKRGVLQDSSANSANIGAGSSADAKTRVVEQELRDLEVEKVRMGALVGALHKFTGVCVTSVNRSADGRTLLGLKVEESCEAIVSLDSSMSVSDLQVTRSEVAVDTAKVLCEACVLPTPQDLRQVCFVLTTMQKAPAAIEDDLTALRRKLLISRLSPTSVQVTFPTGVAARLAIHACYPEVPNGVQAVALDGYGGWTPQELEDLRRDCNCKSFRRLDDMVAYLNNELA
jgi:hypothetical protein